MKQKAKEKKGTIVSYRHNIFITPTLNERLVTFCKTKGLRDTQVFPLALEKFLTDSGF